MEKLVGVDQQRFLFQRLSEENRFRLRCIRLETRFMQRYSICLATTLPLCYFIIRSRETTFRRGTKTWRKQTSKYATRRKKRKKEKRSEESLFIFSWKEGRKEGSRMKRIEIRVGRKKKISMDTPAKGGREERLSEKWMENGQYEAARASMP